MKNYFILHLCLLLAYLYFFVYGCRRFLFHWKDGKEKVVTSSKRLVLKIAFTVSSSILQFAHIADFYPKKYSDDDLVIRTLYFSICGIIWMFSAFLVYFEYSRRLSSQWSGQRSFWILGVLSNIILLSCNIAFGVYSFEGNELYQFDVIQIIIYVLNILICVWLSYYSVFRPNDFSVISSELYKKLKKSTMFLEDTKNQIDEDINLKVSIVGYKIKQVRDISLIQYNICVYINENTYNISRTLADFEALDTALREKFPVSDYPNLNLPGFSKEIRKVQQDNRMALLNSYLSSLCCPDFMTSDLLNFLQIEGDVRDVLVYRNSVGLEEKIHTNEDTGRSYSIVQEYFAPPPTLVSQESTLSESLQWVIVLSIPTFRVADDKTVDYYLKSLIPSAKFEKIKPYKYKEILELHKGLKKLVQPAVVLNFPSKNYAKSLKNKDKEAIELRKKQFEYYFSVILNDPAYLSRDLLDFIGYSSEPAELFSEIPLYNYRIHQEESEWEGEISDDSSHFIMYSFIISREKCSSGFEVQWKISKRFREFDSLNKKLTQRHTSPLLKTYLQTVGRLGKEGLVALPVLPCKTISPLSTLTEIVDRKKGLENYLSDLLRNPAVTCSYVFREFIEDKSYDF